MNTANTYSQITPVSGSKSHRFCLAPMMEWSTRDCRFFWRIMTKHARLYTEMVTTGALIHGDVNRFLDFNETEHPIALQVGGSNSKELAKCAQLAQQWGYDEINLNCGCPSDRVQNGKIGAILMAEPSLVADCIKAMQDACNIEVSIKHRIGIDDMDDEKGLHDFVDKIAQTGCKTFVVHARKAWLKGLSPKENREVPPLRYDLVHNLKNRFEGLNIIINGGINTLDDSLEHLQSVDGVMIGREAYHNPFILADVDTRIFGENTTKMTKPKTREAVLEEFIEYAHQQVISGVRLHHLTKHILGLYFGQRNGKLFRRFISERACKPDSDIAILKEALNFMSAERNLG